MQCWPNARHCTCTDGKRKRNEGGREERLRGGGGVDKDRSLRQYKGISPSSRRRAKHVTDLTTFEFYPVTKTPSSTAGETHPAVTLMDFIKDHLVGCDPSSNHKDNEQIQRSDGLIVELLVYM